MILGNLKSYVRLLFQWLKLDITKNIKYDRLSNIIISKTLSPSSVAVDVGCHKGEILDLFIKVAPYAKHYAFEPLPDLYKALHKKYGAITNVFPYAMSDKSGHSTFNFVKNAPAYSGILKRKYDINNPEIQQIQVEVQRLDDIIPTDINIDLIKIDVEGAELGVLKGGEKTISRCKPIILFEFGLGGSDIYGTSPKDISQFFDKLNYHIYTLEDWLKNKNKLSETELKVFFETGKEYYYIAAQGLDG